MTELRLDPQAVIADLDELADKSGGRFAGAKRLAWTPEWLGARSWLTSKLADVGLEPERDQAGNLWARLDGARERFMIVGSHIDAVPSGGWLDGALGLMTALETIRQLARARTPPPIGVRSTLTRSATCEMQRASPWPTRSRFAESISMVRRPPRNG